MSRKKKKRSAPPQAAGSEYRSGNNPPRGVGGRGEEVEPVAERRPVPVFLVVLSVLLVYVGDMYVMDHGADVQGKTGAFPKIVFDPYRTYQDLEEANPTTPEQRVLASGKAKFELYCSACHQTTGLGNPATGVPPLAGSEWVKTPGPGRAIRIVLYSVTGPIQVAGKTFDSNAMLAWAPQLTDEDIAAILSYVRANKDWGNNASLVTPEAVKKLREAHASRTSPWTAEEISRFPDTE